MSVCYHQHPACSDFTSDCTPSVVKNLICLQCRSTGNRFSPWIRKSHREGMISECLPRTPWTEDYSRLQSARDLRLEPTKWLRTWCTWSNAVPRQFYNFCWLTKWMPKVWSTWCHCFLLIPESWCSVKLLDLKLLIHKHKLVQNVRDRELDLQAG